MFIARFTINRKHIPPKWQRFFGIKMILDNEKEPVVIPQAQWFHPWKQLSEPSMMQSPGQWLVQAG